MWTERWIAEFTIVNDDPGFLGIHHFQTALIQIKPTGHKVAETSVTIQLSDDLKSWQDWYGLSPWTDEIVDFDASSAGRRFYRLRKN